MVAFWNHRHDKYCGDDGTMGLNCSKTSIGTQETFRITILTTGTNFQFAFKSTRTNKFCGDFPTPTGFTCDIATSVGQFETFTYYPVSGLGANVFGFVSGRTNQYCGYSSPFVCNANSIGPWERFTYFVAGEQQRHVRVFHICLCHLPPSAPGTRGP
jgi:hypothetical protein